MAAVRGKRKRKRKNGERNREREINRMKGEKEKGILFYF